MKILKGFNMKKFCANPLCELNKISYNGYHEIKIDANTNIGLKTVETKIVKNFLYRNNSGTTEFFLCETCHNAVELTKKQ
jgi:hypothetical protein